MLVWYCVEGESLSTQKKPNCRVYYRAHQPNLHAVVNRGKTLGAKAREERVPAYAFTRQQTDRKLISKPFYTGEFSAT
ncbi:hypothetical protein DPMN_120483 [Dreissena polymorpha]|uniref:Uncharacterized protein n=1 Tax=Dreissena polymorpha TaxID=45954 RepID=A0A9D4GKX1_DREPO|nr:hypothetical protein DPMN_120483 [Dreissena polymorpha]